MLANICAQVLFGFSYLFIRMGMAVVHQDAIKFLAFRFTLGFVVMTLLVFFDFASVNYRKHPLSLIFLCAFLNPLTSQVLETMSTTYAPVSLIAIYNSVIPVLMLGFGVLINREYPTGRQCLFVLLTVGGMALSNFVGAEMQTSPLGLVLVITNAVVLSLQRVLVRKASAFFLPMKSSTCQLESVRWLFPPFRSVVTC